MKIRFLIIVAIFFGSLNLMSLGQNNTEGSEMALLMRKALQFLKTEKQNITTNAALQSYPKEFEQFKTAKVTEGKNLSADHQLYLNQFYTQLSSYYEKVSPAKRIEQFNLLINSCMQCHEHECPGPIPSIKKNRF
jgi:hypothetical protein